VLPKPDYIVVQSGVPFAIFSRADPGGQSLREAAARRPTLGLAEQERPPIGEDPAEAAKAVAE